jgi:hemerythrin-like domain-containing protein
MTRVTTPFMRDSCKGLGLECLFFKKIHQFAADFAENCHLAIEKVAIPTSIVKPINCNNTGKGVGRYRERGSARCLAVRPRSAPS